MSFDTLIIRLYENFYNEAEEVSVTNSIIDIKLDKVNIKLVYDNDLKKGFIYISSHNVFKKISEELYRNINYLIESKNEGTITQKDDLILNYIIESIIQNKPTYALAETEDFFYTKVIDHINIIVGNQCNLRCSYCYANEGTYDFPITGFSLDKFKNVIIDLVQNQNINEINSVSFFGGEPFLYIDIINEICCYFKELHKDGSIINVPSYAVITNGTIINECIISVLKKFSINITISLDGDKNINDINRKYKSGMGTYNDIIENIAFMKKNGMKVDLFEVTYTKEHEMRKIQKKDIYNYISSKFPSSMITIVDCMGKLSPQNADDLFYIQDEILYALDKLKTSNYDKNNYEMKYDNECNRVIQILKGIKTLPDLQCDIGVRGFTIYPNGNIYPCQLFISDDYKLHDGDDIIDINKFRMNVNKYKNKLLKSSRKECESCWCKNFCVICAKRIIDGGDIDKICDYRRTLIEQIMLALI